MKMAAVPFLVSACSTNRGVALVIVLWIFIFLSATAFDFSIAVREEGMVARRYVEETEGYFLALAGFQERLYKLLSAQSSDGEDEGAGKGLDLGDGIQFGEWHEAALGGGFYRVRIVDEGGKINLNAADDKTLTQIFANIGITDPRLGIIVDSILDWRDEDQLHRVNGAEDDYYLSLTPPYRTRNSPFDTTEDLLWVRGITPELFYGLEENGVVRVALKAIFTVETRGNQVNLRTVSPAVCQALVGGSEEECDRFVDQRKSLSEKTLNDLLGLLSLGTEPNASIQFISTNPSVVTIEGQGYRSRNAVPSRLSGVVRLLGAGRGFRLVRWVDQDPWTAVERPAR